MTTTTPHRFTLDELDALDAMAPLEEVALMMLDIPELAFDAVVYYLNHRPDRHYDIAQHYYNSQSEA